MTSVTKKIEIVIQGSVNKLNRHMYSRCAAEEVPGVCANNPGCQLGGVPERLMSHLRGLSVGTQTSYSSGSNRNRLHDHTSPTRRAPPAPTPREPPNKDTRQNKPRCTRRRRTLKLTLPCSPPTSQKNSLSAVKPSVSEQVPPDVDARRPSRSQ